jgi:SPP1 gp7 family putative phage head morphogenesis protein
MALSKAKLKARMRRRKRAGRIVFSTEIPDALDDAYISDVNRITVLKVRKLLAQYLYPILDRKTEAADAQLTDALDSEIKAALERISEEYSKNLVNNIANIATEHFERVDGFQEKELVNEIEKAIGVNIAAILQRENLDTELRQYVKKNVGLIRRIPRSYLARVRRIITQGLDTGKSSFSMKKEIREATGIEYRHARLIARDQTSKLFSSLNEIRQRRSGVTHYFWRTVGDERVRPTHRANEGKRFAWNDPPATGHPGTEVLCRCVADPDLSPLLDEDVN